MLDNVYIQLAGPDRAGLGHLLLLLFRRFEPKSLVIANHTLTAASFGNCPRLLHQLQDNTYR